METPENIKELLDNMPATINVNDIVGILIIRKYNSNYLTYSVEYLGDDNMPLDVEVASGGHEYAISIGNELGECLIDLKERIKKYI